MQAIRTAPLLLLLVAACRQSAPAASLPVVDFIKEAHRAEQSPAAYTVRYWTAGTTLPALVGPSPGRLIWTLPVPRGSRFETRAAAAGAPVRIRVGVSDARIYEHLGEATLTPGAPWTPIAVDLSAYAGWKLSLFYRPDRLQWRLVLSADAVSGAPGTIAWGTPQIVTSTRNALEYESRRARLTRNGAP